MSHLLDCFLKGYGIALLCILGLGLLILITWLVYCFWDWLLDDEDDALMATIVSLIFVLFGGLFTASCMGIFG